MHCMGVIGEVGSLAGGLIQTAVGADGGCGATPLNRLGLRANAASRVEVRCLQTAAARW